MTDPPPDSPRRTPLWQVALVFGLLTTLYAAVSIQQYNRLDAYVFDLGFFESIIRDYAQGHLPQLPLTDSTNAVLHFSPALSLLAPVVLLWSSPIAVLLVQAVAVAAGVIPLMRAAGGGLLAWGVAVSYGLAPGFAALIGFDFHEVALAVPLLAFSMAAMLRSDHRAAVLWALPLVLVKEDLGLTVAALGVVVFLRGSRRWGIVAMVFGAITFMLIALWLLPATQDSGSFAAQYGPAGPSEALQVLANGADHKLRTVLFLLVPTGFLALRSPMLLLVTLPTYGWRFVSDRSTYWDPWYQYDAVLVPVAVAAMIEGARLLSAPMRRLGLGAALVGTLVLVPQLALSQVWDRDFWRTPDRTAEVDRVLAEIPTGSRVAASDSLGARIALRTELYLVGDTYGADGPPLSDSEFEEVEWVAFDTKVLPAQVPAWKGFARLLATGDFNVVAEGGGVIVAQRDAR